MIVFATPMPEPKQEIKEKSKTDGATAVYLPDRAETRNGVLERAAKSDSSTSVVETIWQSSECDWGHMNKDGESGVSHQKGDNTR